MIFDIENSLWKSNQHAYNPGGWLILKALLKNGVAKGVASDSHDTNKSQHIWKAVPCFLLSLISKSEITLNLNGLEHFTQVYHQMLLSRPKGGPTGEGSQRTKYFFICISKFTHWPPAL